MTGTKLPGESFFPEGKVGIQIVKAVHVFYVSYVSLCFLFTTQTHYQGAYYKSDYEVRDEFY